eukprot:s325_g26.t1
MAEEMMSLRSEKSLEAQPSTKRLKRSAAEENGEERQESEASFTFEAVKELIDEAQKFAALEEGRVPVADAGVSHPEEERNSTLHDGSSLKEGEGSQRFHQAVQRIFAEQQEGRCSKCTVGDLGTLVGSALMILEDVEDQSCRPRPITGCRDIFPLPVPERDPSDPQHSDFCRALVLALNSLHGSPHRKGVSKPSPAAIQVMKRLKRVISTSPLVKAELQGISFQRFFSTKGLDYSREEVKIAQQVSWDLIAPSFPDEIATLDLRDFCEGGVHHFVCNIDSTIVDESEQVIGKTPSVMVRDEDWEVLATNLVKHGLCKVVPQSRLHHIGSQPLLNGLFAVGKDEVQNQKPVGRLIMNLKPWNKISRPLHGDISTLPMITNMGALHLVEGEVLLTSSEDLRCFFYLFKTPADWEKFMGFGKKAPASLVPADGGDEPWYLTAQVLPMGYLNSVGIAQHIHRRVICRAVGLVRGLKIGVQELRRDRLFSSCPNLCRVYLDNFDQLQKVDKKLAMQLSGTPSDLVTQVREYYADHRLPRHPKKSVEQALEAEVQGAWLDGDEGTLCAKPNKIVKYIELTLEALRRGRASQRELQVIGGGLVYASMFRRPLMSGLNQIWRAIVEAGSFSPYKRFWMTRPLMIELFRHLALLPLAFMNFRAPFDAEVTASDASLSGGGISVSRGLTPYGVAASLLQVRGDVPEELDTMQVLSIGLFDGIAALRVALDVLGAPVCGHVSIEKNAEAQRVVEANFPDSLIVQDVEAVDEPMVQQWALQFSGASLVLVGAGPPCQGVSGLNYDRKGALKDERSRLFVHVPRIVKMCRKFFPWAQVHLVAENVASMDGKDCEVMNEEFDLDPWFIDSHQMSLAHRPRLYWITWELVEGPGIEIFLGSDGRLPIQGQVHLLAEVEASKFLEQGWRKVEPGKPFPTFTTSRPSPVPMRRPAGLRDCDEEERARWKEASHRFPPYQFMRCHCLENSQGRLRPPSIIEREVIMGFPSNYTVQCMKKQQHGSQEHEDARLTLVGNSWHVGVVAWLISKLLRPLGLCHNLNLQELVNIMTPGRNPLLQGLLLRPPLGQGTSTHSPSEKLVEKLSGMLSLKGEDLLLQSSTEVPVRYHRLRSSLPSKLWRWKTVSGWSWKGSPEHINVLEARALMTTIKWRVCQKMQTNELERKYILNDQGQDIPVGLFECNWATSELMTTMAQIWIEEALGYHTEIPPQKGKNGASAIWALAGCTNFDDANDKCLRSCYHCSFPICSGSGAQAPTFGVLRAMTARVPSSHGSLDGDPAAAAGAAAPSQPAANADAVDDDPVDSDEFREFLRNAENATIGVEDAVLRLVLFMLDLLPAGLQGELMMGRGARWTEPTRELWG